MRSSLNEAVQESFGQDVSVEWSEPVSGGDINEAYHLLLTGGEGKSFPWCGSFARH